MKLRRLGGKSFTHSFCSRRLRPRPASGQARLSFPTAKQAKSNSRQSVLPSKSGCSPPIATQSCSTLGLSLPASPRSTIKLDYSETAEAPASAGVPIGIGEFFSEGSAIVAVLAAQSSSSTGGVSSWRNIGAGCAIRRAAVRCASARCEVALLVANGRLHLSVCYYLVIRHSADVS